jgi:glycerol-3-phosphate dehydrogenase
VSDTRADLRALTAERYDVAVVGAGVYGAFVAWDAALRGLRVALVDRGDFGGGTSANSLKLVHGGLRYLQSADLRRMRESVRERAILLRAAPHLVRPLPCVMPTSGRALRSRGALAVALLANDVVSFDRNLSREPARQIPRGRTVGREEFRRLAGPLAVAGATGGALWHDGLMTSPERLLLAVVRAAVAAGATAANYVEATGLLRADGGGRVVGVRVRATDGSGDGELRARLVVNAAGPAAAGLAPVDVTLVRACNVVVQRAGPATAVAVPNEVERRMLFAVPWRGALMLGTSYHANLGTSSQTAGARDDHRPAAPRATASDVEEILAAFNGALPALRLRPEEVAFTHAGLLPGAIRGGVATPLDQPVLVDHERVDGLPGLVTVQGVKWTTARAVATRVVDLCQRRLGLPARPGGTDWRPVHGGDVGSLDAFYAAAPEPAAANVPAPTLRRLRELYGTAYREVLAIAAARPALARPIAPGSDVIGAQVVHAVRVEMARRLGDIVLRRTEMGTAGYPGDAALDAAARLAGEELGWPPERVRAEVGAVRDVYA